MTFSAHCLAKPTPDIFHMLGSAYLLAVVLICPRTMSIIALRSRYVLTSDDQNGSVIGVDGCPAGWVCFHVDLQSRRTETRVVSDISEVMTTLPRPRLVAIDIPIGLPAKGSRACDIAVRKMLGKPRSNSVFPAPVRAVLNARNYEEACALALQAHGKSLSRQAFEIIRKIREVDELMTANLQTWVFEVHPEVSFWALNGKRSLNYGKLTREGRDERFALLLPHYPQIEQHIAELKPKGVGGDDLLDAGAAAWTAERVATGEVPRQFDSKGLRMEIVF
jgi:predicted RNase H-like nuclease